VSDIRSHIEDHLDDIARDPEKREKLNDLLDRALGQKTGDYFHVDCKHCKRAGKYWLEFPKTAKDVQAVKELVELTKGKVAQKIEKNVTVTFDVPMEDWTMDQLRQVASQEVIEDGDFEPLALPAADPQGSG